MSFCYLGAISIVSVGNLGYHRVHRSVCDLLMGTDVQGAGGTFKVLPTQTIPQVCGISAILVLFRISWSMAGVSLTQSKACSFNNSKCICALLFGSDSFRYFDFFEHIYSGDSLAELI